MRRMVDLRHFDPIAAPAGAWARYHDFRRAQAEEDDPGEPLPADADFAQDARKYRPLHEIHRDVAWRDGAIVGNVGCWLRRPGSPEHDTYAPFVYVWGGVLRRWRRRGIGTRLAGALLGFMQARGKTVATFNARLPEGHAFLTAIGAVEKHRSITNRLTLSAVDWERLARWERLAEGSALRWEVHAGRVPVDRLSELQPQLTALLADVPLGALDRPPIR
jgi:GNAT superfamily N-acetyltransferase